MPLGMFRGAKHGKRHDDTWLYEARKMPNGNAIGHLPQRLVKEEETQRHKNGFFVLYFTQNRRQTF